MVSLIEGERVVAFADLAPQVQRMLLRAKEKLALSHHPYSKSGRCVAAAVWVVLPTGQNRYHTSPNIEVRPRSGACAEDGAIQITYAQGHQQYAQAICVIDQFADGSPTERVPHPCAGSRGWIAEVAKESEKQEDFPVIMSTTNFDRVVVTTLGVLLPHPFDGP